MAHWSPVGSFNDRLAALPSNINVYFQHIAIIYSFIQADNYPYKAQLYFERLLVAAHSLLSISRKWCGYRLEK